MKYLITLLIISIFTFSMVSALSVNIPVAINYTEKNVNNSQYLQGYTPTTLYNYYKSLFDSVYCKLTGCDMAGDIDMNSNDILNVNNITANNFNGNWNGSVDYSKHSDGTAVGQMSFWDGSEWVETETSELFWDDTNKRLGIGTDNPQYELDIDGFANTKSIHQISEQGSVGAWSLNKKNSLGSVGSEIILDASTENNHGTNHGATFTTDFNNVTDGALNFDGTNDYIDLDDAGNESFTEMTISAWFKPSSFTPDAWRVMLHRNDGISVGTSMFFIGMESGTNQIIGTICANTGGTTHSSGKTGVNAQLNTWYHVVSSWDGTTVRTYLDGVEKVSYSLSTADYATANKPATTRIGSSGDGVGYLFNGLIGEVGIWNRASTPEEVKQLYLQKAHIKNSYVSQKDVTVDTDGNVGIGTTTPSALLHVDGTSEFEGIINTNGNWISGDGGSEGISVDSTGKVGIGTTEPQTMLHVTGPLTSVDGLGLITAFTPTGGYSRFSWWDPASPDTKFAFGSGYADVSRFGIHIKTSGNFLATTERLTILNNGNVGIATTSPSEKLEVVGNVKASGYISGKKCGVFASLDNATATTITTAGTYYPIAGNFTNSPMEEFVAATTYTPGIKYIGTKTQYFEIDWHAVGSGDSAGITTHLGIKKNGVLCTGGVMGTFLKFVGEQQALSGTCVIELATNDEIQLVITADGSGDIVTMNHFTTSITEFFD